MLPRILAHFSSPLPYYIGRVEGGRGRGSGRWSGRRWKKEEEEEEEEEEKHNNNNNKKKKNKLAKLPREP